MAKIYPTPNKYKYKISLFHKGKHEGDIFYNSDVEAFKFFYSFVDASWMNPLDEAIPHIYASVSINDWVRIK